MKRILCVAMAAVSVIVIAACAVPSTETVRADIELQQTVQLHGSITGQPAEGQLHITGDANSGQISEAVANITENTLIIDGKSGSTASADSLKEGDKVIVYLSAAMTKSMPPQAAALALITNVSDNGMGMPTFIIAAEVAENEDGGISVLNQNEDIYVTIPAGQKLEAFYSGDSFDIADIKEGSVLFAWYDFAAMSMPAQATSTKTIVVS